MLADQITEQVVRQPGFTDGAWLWRQPLHDLFALIVSDAAVADGVHSVLLTYWPKGSQKTLVKVPSRTATE
ncbi:hypothetical protein D3C76_1303560 [compost metagenome]